MSIPSPLTLERIAEGCQRIGCAVSVDGRRAVTAFHECYTVVETESEGAILAIYLWSSHYEAPPERLVEAQRWANRWNATTNFAAATPYIDDDGVVMLRLNTSFLVTAGITDEQLDECLIAGLSCNAQAVDDYVQALTLTRRSP